MKLFYLDFWSNSMYGSMSYGDTETISWVDTIDRWGGIEGEWEWIVTYWASFL